MGFLIKAQRKKSARRNSFDSQSFYDWAYEMSKKNIVLISSYEISDERFECAYEFKKARSTFRGGISNKNNKIEKLFMIKKKKIMASAIFSKAMGMMGVFAFLAKLD